MSTIGGFSGDYSVYTFSSLCVPSTRGASLVVEENVDAGIFFVASVSGTDRGKHQQLLWNGNDNNGSI